MFSALILASKSGPVDGSHDFYIVVATILPVLFLALIYQANVIGEWRNKPVAMLVWAIVYVANTVWGETAALHGVVSSHPPSGTKGTVEYSLIIVGGGLAFSPVVAAIPHVVKAHGKPKLVFALCSLATVVIILVAFGQ